MQLRDKGRGAGEKLATLGGFNGQRGLADGPWRAACTMSSAKRPLATACLRAVAARCCAPGASARNEGDCAHVFPRPSICFLAALIETSFDASHNPVIGGCLISLSRVFNGFLEATGCRSGTSPGCGQRPFDLEHVAVDQVVEGEVETGIGAGDQRRAHLVDRDPQVLDVLEAEPEVTGDAGAGEAGDAQVAGLGRHDQRMRDVMRWSVHLEVVGQPGDVEQAPSRLGRRAQHEATVARGHRLVRADDDAEARRVDEAQPTDIEHEQAGAGLDVGVDLGAQDRRGVGIELTGRR